ncbi:MAG: hypothetical protein HN392_13015 [Anaerolineae bacterium]|jgi:hypothetical protein|nr:hypothetical protein [Anaerolineae bacterium]MBT7073316.1 hypothetical protein [Anaerolineae bacterium]MBT7782223.1 hypothetical protein [Anaerolineae bacterium]
MNTYLVVLLIVAIIIFSNLIMFLAVRGSKDMKIGKFNAAKEDLMNPFVKGNSELNELRQRVENLNEPEDKKED